MLAVMGYVLADMPERLVEPGSVLCVTQILEGGLWSLMRAERDRYLVRPGSGD